MMNQTGLLPKQKAPANALTLTGAREGVIVGKQISTFPNSKTKTEDSQYLALVRAVKHVIQSPNYVRTDGVSCPLCGKGNLIGNRNRAWCPECSYEEEASD